MHNQTLHKLQKNLFINIEEKIILFSPLTSKQTIPQKTIFYFSRNWEFLLNQTYINFLVRKFIF